jgi:hypothetical protein
MIWLTRVKFTMYAKILPKSVILVHCGRIWVVSMNINFLNILFKFLNIKKSEGLELIITLQSAESGLKKQFFSSLSK